MSELSLTPMAAALVNAGAQVLDATTASTIVTVQNTETGTLLSLNREQIDAIADAALMLSNADKAFEFATDEVAKMVARVLGTEPTFDHWEATAARFQEDYATERECTPETARKRWVMVAKSLGDKFGLEKPKKASKESEKKAGQRADAATTAAALIEKAGAATPAEVMALMTQPADDGAPLPAPVVQALSKQAGTMVADATKAAAAAAKEETKNLRESIRKGCQGLNLVQLRQVAELVASFTTPADGIVDAAEEAAETSAEEVAAS